MAEQQRIHPVAVEAPPQSAPLVPPAFSRSDRGEPAVAGQYPRTIPVAHSRQPKKRQSRCKCLCWTIIALLVLVAATLGILYVVFDPKLPKYSVDRLQVSAFRVDPSLTAHTSFDVTVTAENPNEKIGIYYERGSHLSVWYSGFSLCEGEFPEFYQGRRNATVLTVVLTGEAQLGSAVVAALQQQQQTGMVPLEFRGEVPVRVKLGGLLLWKVTSRVTCSLVVDSLTASNQIHIRASNCKFRLKL